MTLYKILYLVPHLLGPALEVVLVPGETIDEEVVLVVVSHGSLYQRTGDLYWHDCSIGDMVLYQLSKLLLIS